MKKPKYPQALSGQTDVYQHFLYSVQQVAAADGAALLLESGSAPNREPFLAFSGLGETLADLSESVQAVAGGASESQDPFGAQQYPIRYFPGPTGTCLLRVAVDFSRRQRPGGSARDLDEPERRKLPDRRAGESCEYVWVGLYYEGAAPPEGLQQLHTVDPTVPGESYSHLAHTLILGASLVVEHHKLARLLRDPTSQLPTRAEFQASLKLAFQQVRDSRHAIAVLLVNPDDFGAINERLDHESGDRAVAELAVMLRDTLRQTDRVFRYGGAVFAVLIPRTDKQSVEMVANKLRQALTGAYLDGAVRLTFSVGGVVYDGTAEADKTLDHLGLLRRADHALNLAKRAGGGCTVIWSPEESTALEIGVDRLSGIFTADAEKDYRNMLLLWDTIAVISSSAQKEQIAREFVNRINLSLKPRRVALLEYDADAGARQLAVAQRSVVGENPALSLTDQQAELVANVRESRHPEQLAVNLEGDVEGPLLCYGVPVLVDGHCLGCLYLDGPANGQALDSSDLVFLEALAGQLGLALDRADLATRWKEETERESRRLREEVHDLRQVVKSARLVYSSSQIQAVLDMLRAVAPTDVTILIDGESGTGKEMLARAVHEMSERKDQPLVTVDCGAIAHNLLEAELFGYVKGAFTGAHRNSEGRIAQADGGTIFLDEIGEIPLDVQAKLLRFVQEKEINPVGATRSRRVNTRIVAATNRDLAAESAAGRFREDLYYRLKVVTVTAPPLRDRPDDILPLAKHFLDKFSLQYEKRVRRFSAEAEQQLHHYRWPGNVRELQNCILRAVVLSQGEVLLPDMLQFEDTGLDSRPVPPAEGEAQESSGAPAPTPHPGVASKDSFGYQADSGDPWEALSEGLARQVEIALTEGGNLSPPLGRWLTEDLVLAASEAAGGNARRASSHLCVPETTYRRQLEKVRRTEQQGLLARTQSWEGLHPVLASLVRSAEGGAGGNIIERVKSLLLDEVAIRVAGDDALGSVLMGVTVPTYRRWKNERDEPGGGARSTQPVESAVFSVNAP